MLRSLVGSEMCIRDRSCQLLSSMTYTEGLQFGHRPCQLYSFMTYTEGLQFFTLGSSISPQIYTASEVHAFLFEIDPDIIPRVSHITSCEIDHEHHVVDFVSHTWQFLVPFLVHIIRDRSGKATEMIAGICTFPRLPCPSIKRHVMLNVTSTEVCNTGSSARYVCNLLL